MIFKCVKDSRIIIEVLNPELDGIPGNSVRFRSIPEFRPHPHLLHCVCRSMSWTRERFRNGIPELHRHGIRRNSREFRAIPESLNTGIAERNRMKFKYVKDSRIIIEVLNPELDGIPGNSVRFRNSALTLTCRLVSADICPGHASDSGTEFRNCIDTELDGIPGNSVQYRAIPCDSGIDQLRNR